MAPKRIKEPTPDEAERLHKEAAEAVKAAEAVITAPVLGETPEHALARMAYESKRLLFERALDRPFHPNEIKWKPQMVKANRCLAMAYIDARLVQDRLDDVVGVEGWRDEYEVLEGGSVVCRLTVMTPSGLFMTKCDVGSPSEQPDHGDRLKAAFSDALKRAAVKFGIGRYLYRLSAQWVDYDPVKKQIVKIPNLPAWAMPKKEKPEPAVYHDPVEDVIPPVEKTAEKPTEKPAAAATPASPPANGKHDAKPADDEAAKKASSAAAASAQEKTRKEFLKKRLDWWQETVNGCATPAQLTEAISENLPDEPDVSKDKCWTYILHCIGHFGWKWDAGQRQVIDPNEAVPY